MSDPTYHTVTVTLAAANDKLAPQYLSDGYDGWTPVLAGEADGSRTLLKVVDWTGGDGTKPAINVYISTTGYTTSKAAAFNFNPSLVQRDRVKVSTSGTLTYTYATAFPAGYMPTVQLCVEAPAGSTYRFTAQLDGVPGNTTCGIKAFKDSVNTLGAVVTNLLNLVLFAPAPSVWVHISIIPPPVPITT